MNIFKELHYLVYLMKLSKMLYFAKKIVTIISIILMAGVALTLCGNSKNMMCCCKK